MCKKIQWFTVIFLSVLNSERRTPLYHLFHVSMDRTTAAVYFLRLINFLNFLTSSASVVLSEHLSSMDWSRSSGDRCEVLAYMPQKCSLQLGLIEILFQGSVQYIRVYTVGHVTHLRALGRTIDVADCVVDCSIRLFTGSVQLSPCFL